MRDQHDLFGQHTSAPRGFDYKPTFITQDEEASLVSEIERLAFSSVEMRGVVAKRRTAHYGWTYGYYSRRTEPGPPLPEFLCPIRERVASWALVEPDAFAEALITEYTAGAGIGWHRDAPMFGDVIAGISLLAACRMRFRPYVSPEAVRQTSSHAPRRTTHEIELAERSAYVIAGVARREFEHSIPPVDRLRYSITFRTLRR